MNPSLARPVFLLILVAVSGLLPTATLDSQNLIPSLEEVLGPPPKPEVNSTTNKANVFYALAREEPDPEIKEILRKLKLGYDLFPEEQFLFDQYAEHHSISGKNPLIRAIAPEVLTWVEQSVKTPSGARLPFIYCFPRAAGPFPVALVLDPEIGPQMEVGEVEYAQIERLIPVEGELPFDESYRGRYITHNPIANQLISSGVVVVIPVLKNLEHLSGLPLRDWQAVMDFILSIRVVDAESVFLVSTKEFAGTAFRLAGHYEWRGLLVEEPESGIFGASLPASTQDAVAMTELRKKYQAVTGAIKCPVLIMRNKRNPIHRINDFILIQSFLNEGRKLYLSITDRPLRTLEPVAAGEAGERPGLTAPQEYAYDIEATQKLGNRILHFIQQIGASPLRRLPQKRQITRITTRTQSTLNEIERIEERIAGRLQESQGFNSTEEQGFEDNLTGDGAFRSLRLGIFRQRRIDSEFGYQGIKRSDSSRDRIISSSFSLLSRE